MRVIDVDAPPVNEINKECAFEVGQRVWVKAEALPRGKARGEIIRIETTQLSDRVEARQIQRLWLHDAVVRMDVPIRVPAIFYRTVRFDHPLAVTMLTKWPGATEISVPTTWLRPIEGRASGSR